MKDLWEKCKWSFCDFSILKNYPELICKNNAEVLGKLKNGIEKQWILTVKTKQCIQNWNQRRKKNLEQLPK